MASYALDNLERKFVELAAKRYCRGFYRWGHLLGWLVVPMILSMFLPALKPYSDWLLWAAMMLIFVWHFVVSTRVIGKLQSQLSKYRD